MKKMNLSTLAGAALALAMVSMTVHAAAVLEPIAPVKTIDITPIAPIKGLPSIQPIGGTLANPGAAQSSGQATSAFSGMNTSGAGGSCDPVSTEEMVRGDTGMSVNDSILAVENTPEGGGLKFVDCKGNPGNGGLAGFSKTARAVAAWSVVLFKKMKVSGAQAMALAKQRVLGGNFDAAGEVENVKNLVGGNCNILPDAMAVGI